MFVLYMFKNNFNLVLKNKNSNTQSKMDEIYQKQVTTCTSLHQPHS